MKQLIQYILENENMHPLWCRVGLNMFKGAKNISKEDIKSMINTFCDVDGRLKKFSDCLADEYPKEYLAYQPNDDEFLKKDLEDKVCEQIAEFILKTIVNK